MIIFRDEKEPGVQWYRVVLNEMEHNIRSGVHEVGVKHTGELIYRDGKPVLWSAKARRVVLDRMGFA